MAGRSRPTGRWAGTRWGGGQPGAQGRRLGERGGPGRHPARRRVHEPAVPGPVYRRSYPEEMRRSSARPGRISRRRFRHHRAPIDSSHQLQPAASPGPTPSSVERAVKVPSRRRSTRRPAGRSSAALTDLSSVSRPLRQHADLHHRERRRLLRSAVPPSTARSTIPSASTTCASTSAPSAGDRQGWTSAATSSGRCLDNLEWSLVFPSASASSTSTSRPSKRTPKRSARFYREW